MSGALGDPGPGRSAVDLMELMRPSVDAVVLRLARAIFYSGKLRSEGGLRLSGRSAAHPECPNGVQMRNSGKFDFGYHQHKPGKRWMP